MLVATEDVNDTGTVNNYDFLNKRMFYNNNYTVLILMYLYCLITASCFKCLIKGESQDVLRLCIIYWKEPNAFFKSTLMYGFFHHEHAMLEIHVAGDFFLT